MTPRMNPYASAPAMLKDYLDYSNAIHEYGLEHSLMELVKIRASQLNGCANCLNMHTSDARKAGETEQRLHVLAAWHEAPLFSDRERAALDWTDHLTLIADKRAPDAVYAALDAQFSKEEQVALTMLILLSPAMAATALSVRLSSPGPVLFRQRRVGRDRRVFDVLKFRSMRVDRREDASPRLADDGCGSLLRHWAPFP